MSEETQPETEEAPAGAEHSFRAEVNQVLDIVINSLYSHREIFLRELISNAADALDKLRFRAVTDEGLMEGEEELEIQLVPDREAKTLTVIDTGIGMTRDEVIENLGTIAHSGSRGFLEAMTGQNNAGSDVSGVDLIGQFGVGFYSAFLVADRVEVRTLAAGEGQTGWLWTSEARGTFTVDEAPEWTTRGTEIRLHLKEEHHEFLDEWHIRELVRKYSDFVSWPILLEVTTEEGEGDDKKAVTKDETINTASALWRRPRSEIKDEEYLEFYRHVAHAPDEPMETLHFQIEGTTSYTGLLYVPKQAPWDLFERERRQGVRLYVKRVMIMEDCKDFVPDHLRFIRGVIDSDDLPLNVSRELLQEDRTVRTIRKTVVNKVLAAIEQMADKRKDDYAAFWGEFGRVLKEGLHTDFENKDRLANLVRWPSSTEQLTSLAEYVERMPEDQDAIYYAFGTNRDAVENSPHIEALKKRGTEVLYMTDPIDEWAVEGIREFEKKPLKSAMKADLDLSKEATDEEKAEKEANEERLEELCDRAKTVLEDDIEEVRVSNRLTDSPCCLVVPEGGLHAHIERILRAQGQDMPKQKRILEINPDHPVVEKLHLMHVADSDSEEVGDWFRLLHDQALLAEGSPIADPATFARRMTTLMQRALE